MKFYGGAYKMTRTLHILPLLSVSWQSEGFDVSLSWLRWCIGFIVGWFDKEDKV